MSASNRWWRHYEAECREWSQHYQDANGTGWTRVRLPDGRKTWRMLWVTQPSARGTFRV